MENKLQELKERLAEVNDLEMAGAVLSWDQATYLPSGGAPARARQLATLGRLAQEKFIDPSIGRLLDELQPYADGLPYDSDEASLVRVTRQEYERMLKVPPEFLGRFYSHMAGAYQAWTAARPANDFDAARPYLEKTLEMSREMAGFFPGYEHIADPLIDFSDFGMRTASLRSLFAELRAALVPIVRAITEQPPSDDRCLRHEFSPAEQIAFGEEVIRALGYDFQRGRQDLTHHPFTTKFSLGDVRITTRVRSDYLAEALFSTIHEAGHALYEQGICMELEGTPLANGTTSGVHESQSRLWENVVGRSQPFWEYYYPRLQARFPAQLGSTPLEAFYRAINKVERSLIRTDADEVTYNLHILLRFDLELAMLEGRLEVRDLPSAWAERFNSDFGFYPPTDREGALQDVHWFGGMVGGQFQGYTLGNILSAQFFEAACRAYPAIPAEMSRGEFGALRGWLAENIYQHGRKFTAAELVQRATGGPIQIGPYIAYLKKKYGEIYHLEG